MKWLGNIILMLVTLTICVFFLEIVIRFAVPQPLYEENVQNPGFNFMRFDSTLGWEMVPDSSGRVVSSEYDIPVTINNLGFRDDDWGPKVRPRILVIGDSFIYGHGVGQDSRLTEIMQEKLPGYEIMNLGVSGYGNDQQYLTLEEKGLALEPDIVVMAFFANDIENNNGDHQYGKPKPRFQLLDGNLDLTNTPIPYEKVELAKPGFMGKVDRFFGSKSHLYMLFRRSALMGIFNNMRFNEDDSTTIPPEIAFTMRNIDESQYESYQLTFEIINATRNLAKENGAKFLLITVPQRMDIEEDYRNKTAVRLDIDIHDEPFHLLTGYCTLADIDCLDLTPGFRDSDEQLFFKYDNHWNQNGHRVAGELIAEWIMN